MKTTKPFLCRRAYLTLMTLAPLWFSPIRQGFAAETTAPTGLGPTSFEAVTRHLDPGGSLYLYLSTSEWLEKLSAHVEDWQQFFLALPGISDDDRALIRQGFTFASRLIRSSGLEDISGVGLSGVLGEKQLYRTKLLIHHNPERGQGFLWSLFGAAPHPLKDLSFLPANTVVAFGSDLDLPLLWGVLRREAEQADAAQTSAALTKLSETIRAQTGVELDEILASLDGSVTFVLTLDEERKTSVPGPAGMMEIPEPRLGLMIKVKNNTLFGILDKPLQQQEQLIQVNQPGLRMRTIPLSLPFPVRPTVAQTDEYLFLATQEGLVEEMLAVAQGQKPGLQTTEAFQELATGIPLEGNHFNFVSRRFGDELNRIMRSAMQAQTGPGEFPSKLFDALISKAKVGFAVSGTTREGWLVTANQSEHPAMIIAGPAVLAPTAILAGLFLPALAKSKSKAQSISCVSNLKQIGLAGRMYANDHNEVFPLDFLEMKDELFSPKILTCPADPAKKRVDNWGQFDPDQHLSYEFVAPGAQEDPPDRIVFRCPIHGHVGLADGSVQSKSR